MENNNGNVYGNTYANYDSLVQGGRRKFDVRGLVTTIYCLIMSLVVGLSTLMPITTIGTKPLNKSFNIIEEFKIIGEFIDLSSSWPSYIPDETAIGIILVIVAFAIPLLIMIMGVIYTIVYIVRLVSGHYVKGASSFAWTVLILEMMISTFQVIYLVVMTELLNCRVQGDDYGLSVGWYLPVIFALVLLLMNLVMDFIEASKHNKLTFERIFASIAAVITAVMYFSFSTSFFTIARTTEEIDVSFSMLQIMMIGKWDVCPILINVFLVIVAIFVHISVVKNTNAVVNGKFKSVTNILTSVFVIIFAITNYIIFDIYVYDEYRKYTMSMSVGNYMYIIMGSILLVLAIVCLCIKGVSGSKQNMPAYQQYFNQPQQGMQNMNYVNQQPIQNMNYMNNQTIQNEQFNGQQTIHNYGQNEIQNNTDCQR